MVAVMNKKNSESDPHLSTIGRNILDLLHKYGKSKAQLVRQIAMSRTAFYEKLETGFFKEEELREIAAAFDSGVTPSMIRYGDLWAQPIPKEIQLIICQTVEAFHDELADQGLQVSGEVLGKLVLTGLRQFFISRQVDRDSIRDLIEMFA